MKTRIAKGLAAGALALTLALGGATGAVAKSGTPRPHTQHQGPGKAPHGNARPHVHHQGPGKAPHGNARPHVHHQGPGK